MEDQVVILYNAKERFLDKILCSDVQRYNNGLATYFKESAPDVLAGIRETGQLSPEVETKIKELCGEYSKDFKPSSLAEQGILA